MNNKTKFAALPLRQRKFAQTKLGLLNAATAQLSRTPFELILVKDLCRTTGISDASFFNYFEKKGDLITYFVLLWSLEMGWHAQRLRAREGGLAAIQLIFDLTARKAVQQPELMTEIIVEQARMHAPVKLTGITSAERLLAFPDLVGIENITTAGLDQLLLPLIEKAIAQGELPQTVDRNLAMIAIASVFFGTPVTVRPFAMRKLGPLYRGQLQILWNGLQSVPEASRHG